MADASFTFNPDNPEIKAKLEVLDQLPLTLTIIDKQHTILWANKYHYKYWRDNGLSGRFEGTLSQAFKCDIENAPEARKKRCNECPIQRSQKHLGQVQRGTLRMSYCWGQGEILVDVFTIPFTEGSEYLLMSIVEQKSISTNYQLNRIFHHFLLNIGQQLRSTTAMSLLALEDSSQNGIELPHQLREDLEFINDSIGQLVDTVVAERIINNAQYETLLPYIEEAEAQDMLQQSLDMLYSKPEGEKCAILLHPSQDTCTLKTDLQILKINLYDIIYLMLFATTEDHLIEVGYDRQEQGIRFWARDRELELSPDKLQQFKETFSVRRKRTAPSYHLAILAERFLKARIELTSGENVGTTLSLTVPFDISPAQSAEP